MSVRQARDLTGGLPRACAVRCSEEEVSGLKVPMWRPLPGTYYHLFPLGVSGGSWKLLTIDRDLMVAQFSTPNLPPSLVSISEFQARRQEL